MSGSSGKSDRPVGALSDCPATGSAWGCGPYSPRLGRAPVTIP